MTWEIYLEGKTAGHPINWHQDINELLGALHSVFISEHTICQWKV